MAHCNLCILVVPPLPTHLPCDRLICSSVNKYPPNGGFDRQINGDPGSTAPVDQDDTPFEAVISALRARREQEQQHSGVRQCHSGWGGPVESRKMGTDWLIY